MYWRLFGFEWGEKLKILILVCFGSDTMTISTCVVLIFIICLLHVYSFLPLVGCAIYL